MVKKTSKKLRSKNFYFSVVEHIKNNKSLNDVASIMGVSKQLLNYYIYPLKKKGIIYKKGYGVWGFDENKFRQFIEVKTSKKKDTCNSDDIFSQPVYKNQQKKEIRGHGFTFKLPIKAPRRWEQRARYLEKINYPFKSIPQGQSLNINLKEKEFKVWLCKSSLVIYFPKGRSYLERTAEESFEKAIIDCIHIVKRTQNILETDFSTKGKFKIKVSRQHYSFINNEIAKDYLKRKKILLVADKYGKLWALVDNSFNLKELECINSKTAREDTDDVIKPFLNDLREKKPPLPSELHNLINSVAHNQKSITDNQLLYAENIKTHISAIQKLGDSVQQLVKEVKNIKKVMLVK